MEKPGEGCGGGGGGEELGAAPGESALALPAPVLRPGSFLDRFQYNVTCTEGPLWPSLTHSEIILSSLTVIYCVP